MSIYAKHIVDQAKKWIGKKESDGSYKEIIDLYNSHKPLARGYKVKSIANGDKKNDNWCATFVSSVAIACKATCIIPTECGCERMIELFKKLGSWVEDENRVPNPGDILFYDYQDNGKGDNKGWADHVGYVESVKDGVITLIEGNYKDAVSRVTIKVNDVTMRGYAVPKYDVEPVETPKPVEPIKSIEEIVKEVIAGKWGNGSERKAKLTEAGYNADVIQDKVNEALGGTKTETKVEAPKPAPVNPTTPTKTIDEVAREVINGKWGNGADRKARLEKAGHNYSEVQAKVNAILNGKTSSSKSEPAYETYTIKPNDTLTKIAIKFYGVGSNANIQKIAKANNIPNPNIIRTGVTIKIPR